MDSNITGNCNITGSCIFTGNRNDTWNDSYSFNGAEGTPDIPIWGFWVNFIATPIIVLIGCFGNVTSFIVMKSRPLRHKSYSNYLCALAVFDTITLVTRLIFNVDAYYLDHLHVPGLFQNFTDVTCKIYNYFERIVYLMSSWTVVLMASERLCAVKFPFKKVFIRQQCGSLVAIGCLFLIVCMSQSFRFVMVEHAETRPNISTCLGAIEYGSIYTSLDVYYYQMSLTFVLPLISVLVTNTLVLCQIFKIRRDVRDGGKNMTSYNRNFTKRTRTTFMLLIVSFTYVVTLLPVCSLSIFMDAWIKLHPLTTTEEKARVWAVFRSLKPIIDVSQAISLLNYAVNFFIYVLSGKSFRFELRKICTKTSRPKRSWTVRSTREEFIRL